jgi:soluble lytic murein transglycosylase-like protein
MRIDFGSHFKDVSRLLRVSASPATPAEKGSFEGSLNSLLPKPPEITEKSPEPPASSEHQEDIRARYRFDQPALELPSLEPKMPPELLTQEAETAVQGVKTPTIHQVKRIEWAGDLTGGPTPLLGQAEIRQRLQVVGQRFGIDPSLAAAVVKTESGFNARAVSSDGHASKGLFQLLDSTGKDLLARGDQAQRAYDPFDPELNMELGTSYLRYLHDIFKSPTSLPNDRHTKPAADNASLEKLAVAAFNAGEGRVASAQHRAERAGKDSAHYDNVAPFLPASTREYVSRVVSSKKLF